jgi:hypothetical protein
VYVSGRPYVARLICSVYSHNDSIVAVPATLSNGFLKGTSGFEPLTSGFKGRHSSR